MINKILYFFGKLFILMIIVTGCSPGTEEKETGQESEESTASPGVVNIITYALDLQMPDTIKSGWTTFVYENNSPMTHFVILEKLPVFEGRQITVEDSKKDVVPAFQQIMDSLFRGGEPPYDQIPEWFEGLEFLGGIGLVGPAKTVTTYINVQPGVYTVECYVKNPGGQFHSSAGMITGLVVTGESTGNSAPEASLNLTVSQEQGFQMQDTPFSGKHIVGVTYLDQATQENFVGFDVHLVRIADNTDVEALKSWMNWMLPTGLQIPAPAEFLGGVQEMPGGNTIYFEADLQPGKYAFISEVPDPEAKGFYLEFEVGE